MQFKLECHAYLENIQALKKSQQWIRLKKVLSSEWKVPSPLLLCKHFETSISSKPVIQPFNKMGWGLPVRKGTRFTDKQRKLLYDIFIHREELGKKVSPQQSHLQIREKFKNQKNMWQANKILRWSQLKQK